MNEQEKLIRFEEAIYADTENKAGKILEDAELLAQKILSEARREAKRAKKKAVTDKSRKILKQNASEISGAALDSKRELILKRKELTDALFAKVEAELNRFTETKDYAEFLNNSVKSARSLGNGDYIIYTRESDKALIADKATVIADNSIRLGGVKVVFEAEKMMVDLTLDEKLSDAKKKFAHNESLTIE